MCKYHELNDENTLEIRLNDKHYGYRDLVIDLTKSWINQQKNLRQAKLYNSIDEVLQESCCGSLRDYVTGYYHLPTTSTPYNSEINFFSDPYFATNILMDLCMTESLTRAFRPIIKQNNGNEFLRHLEKLCRIKAFNLLKPEICDLIAEGLNLDYADQPLPELMCVFDFPLERIKED